MKRMLIASAVCLLLGGALSTGALAKGKPTTGESGVNNLSFPVILSDNVGPAAFPADGAWRWAPITDPLTQCIGEAGVTPGTAVDPTILCYYGGKVEVDEESGNISFVPPTKVWWLQKRTQNFWKALSVGHSGTDAEGNLTPLVVSAVDIGDLLESSPQIATRQIRVEFNLLQSVPADDPELGSYLADWTTYTGGLPLPTPCVVPTLTGQSIGCFAAFGMSGAVPGTEQSGNEMQGNDFGLGPDPGELTGTLTALDPTTVRIATAAAGPIPIHALVYSRCARLLIQKIGAAPTWDETTGQWAGTGVSAPVVNLPVYTNALSVEITSGGSIVYGYNWNAKTASTGTYRLTFVLDGNDTQGPQCNTPLATQFAAGGTQLVNLGEANAPGIIYAGDSDLGDEGGIAYIDLTLTPKGGGGR